MSVDLDRYLNEQDRLHELDEIDMEVSFRFKSELKAISKASKESGLPIPLSAMRFIKREIKRQVTKEYYKY